VIVAAWLVTGGCIAAALLLLALRSRRRSRVLALADAGSFGAAGRRTWRLWAALAATLVAVPVALAVESSARGQTTEILPPGANAVVVIDISSSTRAASQRIAEVLQGLTRDARQRIGLILFSDTAYEAFPPSTPAEGLKGWLHLFARVPARAHPWATAFSSGTVISSGLILARRVIRRDRLADPHVVLVTDLIDAAPDLLKLESMIAQYQRERIDLKVIAVPPDGRNRASSVFSQFRNAAFIEQAASLTVDPERSIGSDSGGVVLVVLLVGLAGLLAVVYELALHPLTWRAS
jgi:Mg-chelatase subunit ChlD